MTTKLVLVKHMGHEGPWLLVKTRKEVKERIADIKENKPALERPRRLALLKIVTGSLPPVLVKVYAAWQQASAAWQKEDAAWQQASAARHKAYAARQQASAAWLVAINSPEGVAFHAKVCGCSWSPEHPDTLEGLAR